MAAETPFDRFAKEEMLEVRLRITYEDVDEKSTRYEGDGSAENGFVTGTKEWNSKETRLFNSTWHGILTRRHSYSGGNNILEYGGNLEGYISGLAHRVTLEENHGQVGSPDCRTRYDYSMSHSIIGTISGQYPEGLEVHELLYISPEGYHFSAPGGHMSMPGKQRTIYSLRDFADGCYENYNRKINEDNTIDAYVDFNHSCSLRIQGALPDQGLTLTGNDVFSKTHTGFEPESSQSFGPNTRYTVTWTIGPVQERPPVRAVITTPPTITRGEKVQLDGSASTGAITEYKWTFKASNPNPSDAQPDNNATIRAPQTDVTLLDTTQVTLTVTDGKETDSTTQTVYVLARTPDKFGTNFTHVENEGTLNDSTRPVCRTVGKNANGKMEYSGSWTGGENVCAIDPEAASHCLHPNPKSAVPADMFTLVPVDDQGPWNGFYYFRDWKMKLHRKTLLNKYILENAPPLLTSMSKNFQTINQENRGDVSGYLKAIRNHEKMHSDLMEQGLFLGKGGDPAKECEKMFDKDGNHLTDKAVKAIQATEQRIVDKTKDPLPDSWSGRIFVPQDDTDEIHSFILHVGGENTYDFAR